MPDFVALLRLIRSGPPRLVSLSFVAPLAVFAAGVPASAPTAPPVAAVPAAVTGVATPVPLSATDLVPASVLTSSAAVRLPAALRGEVHADGAGGAGRDVLPVAPVEAQRVVAGVRAAQRRRVDVQRVGAGVAHLDVLRPVDAADELAAEGERVGDREHRLDAGAQELDRPRLRDAVDVLDGIDLRLALTGAVRRERHRDGARLSRGEGDVAATAAGAERELPRGRSGHGEAVEVDRARAAVAQRDRLGRR